MRETLERETPICRPIWSWFSPCRWYSTTSGEAVIAIVAAISVHSAAFSAKNWSSPAEIGLMSLDGRKITGPMMSFQTRIARISPMTLNAGLSSGMMI
jgi:hypothetical protein